jgi:CLIP-associating protein 1/2
MEECFVLLRSKDTKERLQALVRAQNLAEHLDLGEVTELTDISLDLLKDNNFKVCLGILLVLTKAVSNSGDHFKHQLNSLLPSVVERLGDGKQPVREAGRRLLLALMEVSAQLESAALDSVLMCS